MGQSRMGVRTVRTGYTFGAPTASEVGRKACPWSIFGADSVPGRRLEPPSHLGESARRDDARCCLHDTAAGAAVWDAAPEYGALAVAFNGPGRSRNSRNRRQWSKYKTSEGRTRTSHRDASSSAGWFAGAMTSRRHTSRKCCGRH